MLCKCNKRQNPGGIYYIGDSLGKGKEVRCVVYNMKTWNIAFELETFLPQPSTTHSLNGRVLGGACFSLPFADFLTERFAVHSPQYICQMY